MEDLRALIVESCTVFGLQSLLVDDVHIVALLPLLDIHKCAQCSQCTLYLCATSLCKFVYIVVRGIVWTNALQTFTFVHCTAC